MQYPLVKQPPTRTNISVSVPLYLSSIALASDYPKWRGFTILLLNTNASFLYSVSSNKLKKNKQNSLFCSSVTLYLQDFIFLHLL